jgi:hypothetical protein
MGDDEMMRKNVPLSCKLGGSLNLHEKRDIKITSARRQQRHDK